MDEATDRPTGKRPNRWTDRERDALVDLELIQFLPVRAVGPERIGEERAILKPQVLGDEIVPRLDLRSKEARAFIERTQRELEPDPRRRALKQRSQLSCFCQWIGLPEQLWYDEAWRECVRWRFANPQQPTIELLPQEWRKRLDEKARVLGRKRRGREASPIDLTVFLWESAPPASRGAASQVLASEYVQARVSATWGRGHRLNRAVLESGLFGRIADTRCTDDLPATLNDPAPSRQQWLKYPLLASGDEKETVGFLLADLIQIEQRATRALDFEELRIPEAYSEVTKRYVRDLKMLPDLFTRIAMVYHILQIEEYALKIESTKRTVFLAADALEHRWADVHQAYVDWTKSFRAHVVRLYLADRTASHKCYWHARFGPARAALKENALLNCVFHREVFAFGGWAKGRATRGGQSLRVDGLTAAYSVRLFKRALKSRLRPAVGKILKDLPESATHGRPAAYDRGRKDICSYIAPLLNALVRRGGYPFGSGSVHAASKRYRKRPELERFEGDLSREYNRTLQWTRKLLSQP